MKISQLFAPAKTKQIFDLNTYLITYKLDFISATLAQRTNVYSTQITAPNERAATLRFLSSHDSVKLLSITKL